LITWAVSACVAWISQDDQNARPTASALIGSFRQLAQLLDDAGWYEKAGKSSLLSGNCITLRLFTLSKGEKGEEVPSADEVEALETISDE
jgi:hypothetical protein